MCVSCTVSEIFSHIQRQIMAYITLKSGCRIVQGHWKWYYSKPWIRLLAFYSTCYLYHFGDKAKLSKNRDFSYPSMHSTLPLGTSPSEFGTKNKNGVATWWLKRFDNMCSCFDWIPACDRRTDRQTDRQTDRRISCDSIVRAMHSIAR